MLKTINAILKPSDDSNSSSSEWNKNIKPLILTTAIGIGTAAIIFGARQFYRARKHDNIPSLEWKGYEYFGGHLGSFYLSDGGWYDWCYERLKAMDWPPIVSLSFPGPRTLLLINDPKLLKFCLETQFENTPKGPDFIFQHQPLLGGGIFASNGETWKFHRKVASRMFSMRNQKEFMYNSSVRNALSVVNKLKELVHEPEVDMNDILGRFTLDTFCEIAFGTNIKSVESYPKQHEFGVAFDSLVHSIDKRYSDPFWRIKEALNIGEGERAIKRDNKIMMDWTNDILDKHGKDQKKLMDEDGDKFDLISLFLKQDKNLSRKELKDIALNFIIAGRDTTRMLLSWCLYELNKNEDVKQRVYEEIDSYTNEPSYADIQTGFRYLEGALCETLRLHPSVPVIGRWCAKDFALPIKDKHGNNHVARKGDEIYQCTYATGRCTKIWGDDALEFKPDRWKEKGINTYDQYTFSVFNINPRLCLGKKFAMTEAKVFMYHFCKKFTFEKIDGKEPKIQSAAVLNMANGHFVKLSARK